MNLTNPYVTVKELVDELGNESEDADQLTRAINAASRYVDRHLGRDFFFHDHSTSPLVFTKWSKEIQDDWLFLPYRPVITLTEVKVCGDVWQENTHFIQLRDRKQETYALASMGVSTRLWQRGAALWPVGVPPEDTIEIKGTFGYAQTVADGEDASLATTKVPEGMPEEIRQATLLIAAAFSGHNTKDVIGLDGGIQSIKSKDIPKAALAILGPPRTRF